MFQRSVDNESFPFISAILVHQYRMKTDFKPDHLKRIPWKIAPQILPKVFPESGRTRREPLLLSYSVLRYLEMRESTKSVVVTLDIMCAVFVGSIKLSVIFPYL